MIIGFTGTRLGMTRKQKDAMAELLSHYEESDRLTEFHHGGCHGADLEAHTMVHKLSGRRGRRIVVWPGDAEQEGRFRSGEYDCDVLNPVLPYLQRNTKIVDASAQMLAAPGGYRETTRGGTWYTIRYARNNLVPLTIVYPNGLLRVEV